MWNKPCQFHHFIHLFICLVPTIIIKIMIANIHFTLHEALAKCFK